VEVKPILSPARFKAALPRGLLFFC
jgi:hypothetical protein